MRRNERVSLDVRTKSRWNKTSLYTITVLITAVLLIEPIRTSWVRAAILVGLMIVWMGALNLTWKRPFLRTLALLLVVPPLLVGLMPDRPFDNGWLQAEYVHCLQRFNGVPYVWGGETHTGVDCSGLLRVGLVDAEVEIGIKTGNPRLLRHAAGLWWNDCSAKQLGEDFQDRTIRTVSVSSLNDADYSLIRTGDLAIVGDGTHALAYIGERRWIEASPTEKKVVTVTLPSQDVYFSMPAQIVRWRIMDHY